MFTADMLFNVHSLESMHTVCVLYFLKPHLVFKKKFYPHFCNVLIYTSYYCYSFTTFCVSSVFFTCSPSYMLICRVLRASFLNLPASLDFPLVWILNFLMISTWKTFFVLFFFLKQEVHQHCHWCMFGMLVCRFRGENSENISCLDNDWFKFNMITNR